MRKLELQNFEDILVNRVVTALSSAYCYGQVTRFIEEDGVSIYTVVYELTLPSYNHCCVLVGTFERGILSLDSVIKEGYFVLHSIREDISGNFNSLDGCTLDYDFFVFDTVEEGLQWFYDNTLLKEKV